MNPLPQVARSLLEPGKPRGRRLVVGAADYAVQSLYHGLLLFVLPAYWASATFDSPNVAFLACVAAAVSETYAMPKIDSIAIASRIQRKPAPWARRTRAFLRAELLVRETEPFAQEPGLRAGRATV